jgi:hypothetical protein
MCNGKKDFWRQAPFPVSYRTFGCQIQYCSRYFTVYAIIRSIYADIKKDMELDVPFEPTILLANSPNYPYSCKRAIIESISGGIDAFVSEGQLTKQIISAQQIQGGIPMGMIPNMIPQTLIQDNRTFEGWRHI